MGCHTNYHLIYHELTPEQRVLGAANARDARMARARAKAEMKRGALTVAAALDDPRLQTAPIRQFLMAVPKIGAARAARIMRECEISESRRVRGLGKRQRARLIEYLG